MLELLLATFDCEFGCFADHDFEFKFLLVFPGCKLRSFARPDLKHEFLLQVGKRFF